MPPNKSKTATDSAVRQPGGVHVAGVQPDRRVRKASVRAELEQRGESKIDYLASVLGVSRSYVARCLSDAHRDEFSPAHMLKLGIAGTRAA